MQRPASASAAPDVVTMSGVRFRWPGHARSRCRSRTSRLPARQRVLLVGPSGTGKSTFLSLLCGIVAPVGGRLQVLGTDLTRLSNAARDRFRAEHFGVIFQMFNLLPYGSVLDNVMLPLAFARDRRRRAERNGSAEDEARRLLRQPRARRRRAGGAFGRELQRRPAAARRRGARADRRPGADRRRRADLGARPRPAARFSRSAVRRGARRPVRRSSW